MKSCDKLIDVGRRQFLRGGATTAAAGIAAVLPAAPAAAAPSLARVDYRPAILANVRELKVDDPVQINYPDNDSPGVLLKLGRSVDSGVGPDRDIVAFSTLCPHKGFPLNYLAADKSLNCPGHYSRFDCERGGQQIWGQATQNLPQFKLAIDREGNIFATGVDELIYGRHTNVLRG
jgi:arsenite oxidase small subunit